MPSTLSRRTVLRGLGTTVALPVLAAMSETRLLSAAAVEMEVPLRMAFFYVPNGMHMPDWTPAKEGARFDLPPTLAKLSEHRKSFNGGYPPDSPKPYKGLGCPIKKRL